MSICNVMWHYNVDEWSQFGIIFKHHDSTSNNTWNTCLLFAWQNYEFTHTCLLKRTVLFAVTHTCLLKRTQLCFQALLRLIYQLYRWFGLTVLYWCTINKIIVRLSCMHHSNCSDFQGRRNRGGGHRGYVPPNFFQRTKSALFCDEKCPFCTS
jgi:hypothetical protein